MTMSATHTSLRLPVTVCGSIIVILHILAMVFPSGITWGFHHLAFLPSALSIPILVLMAIALVPSLQERMVSLLQPIENRRRVTLWIVSICVLALLLWVFRQETFFLGDGYLVIRNLSRAISVEGLHAPFPTAPFPAFVAFQLKSVLASLSVEPAAQLAWQILSVASGLLAVPMSLQLARALTGNRPIRWLVAFFLLAGGASQLFFGYVETYPLAYVATMLFLWLSMDFLKGRRSFIFASLAFGLLLTLHFGMLSLAPAAVVLLVVGIRRNGILKTSLSLMAASALVVLVLWMCGYTAAYFLEVFQRSEESFLPLTLDDNWRTAYSLASIWHLLDHFNAYILLSPFVFVVLPVAVAAMLKRGMRERPETIFLLLAMLAGLGWTVMMNFEVGMSRDWDVMAPLSVCVVAFSLFGLVQRRDMRGEVRQLLLGMAMVTALHTAAWVAVNADEGRSIKRHTMLQDGRVRSRRAIAYACEDLARFYRDREQYADAIPFMEKAVAIDSTNARRWLFHANICQLAGREEDAIAAYERSIEYGIRDKAAYFNLGFLYFHRHRVDDAIGMLQRAVAIDPEDAKISAGLKFMISKKTVSEAPKD